MAATSIRFESNRTVILRQSRSSRTTRTLEEMRTRTCQVIFMDFIFSGFLRGSRWWWLLFKQVVSVATSSNSLHVLMADLVEGAAIKEVYAAEGERFDVGRVGGCCM